MGGDLQKLPPADAFEFWDRKTQWQMKFSEVGRTPRFWQVYDRIPWWSISLLETAMRDVLNDSSHFLFRSLMWTVEPIGRYQFWEIDQLLRNTTIHPFPDLSFRPPFDSVQKMLEKLSIMWFCPENVIWSLTVPQDLAQKQLQFHLRRPSQISLPFFTSNPGRSSGLSVWSDER
jgi:hypothetical protein